MKVFALIPAYNPPNFFYELLNSICKSQFIDHVIVVDDGCLRPIDEELSKKPYTNNNLTVLRQSKNSGKGTALKEGMKYIDQQTGASDLVISIDADGQHLLKDAEKIIEVFKKEKAVDVTFGVRDFNSGSVPFKSSFGNKITTKLLNLIYKTNLSDTQTGLRAFKTSFLKPLYLLDGVRYEYEANMIKYLLKNKITIHEVKITTVYFKNNQGSYFRPVLDSIKIYKHLFFS